MTTKLSADVFGDAVMVLEFLHIFGPLFNIREVIPTKITFGEFLLQCWCVASDLCPPMPTAKLEHALVSSDPDSLLFEVVKFLLQAVFAVMEEEKEGRVEVYTGDSIAELEVGGEGKETGNQEPADPEAAEDVTSDAEDEKPTLMDEEEEREKPLDIRVEIIKASAALFAKWPFLTQRSLLSQLVMDSFTCTEILRLHLLASGGYADHPERKLFRVHRRGNYSDADDPAIALRLRRPDILNALAQSCICDLPPADKIEILSTLCSQLLSYSVSREHIEEAAHRAKKARKGIREIHNSERRREKEEKARLKKQERDKLEKAKGKVEAPLTTDIPKGSQPAMSNRSEEDGIRKETPEPPMEDPMDGARMDVEEAREEEAQRKMRIAGQLKDLNEELVEASAMVNLLPIGSDRYHRKYWYFLSLPGLYVEDSGHFPTEPYSQQRALGCTEQHQQESQVTASSQPSLTKLSAQDTVDCTGSPLKSKLPPPPLIHISQVGTLAPDRSGGDSKYGPPSQAATSQLSGEDSKSGPPSQAATSQLSWSYFSTPEEIDTLVSSLNHRGLRELSLIDALEKVRSSILRSVNKCPFAPLRERSPTPPPKYTSADKFMELYLREQILDIEEKIYLGSLGALRGVEDRLKWRESIESSGAAADLATREEEEGPNQMAEAQGLSLAGEGKSGNLTPTFNPSVRELSHALLDVQAGIESKFLMPPLGMAVDEKKQKHGKKIGVVRESDLCLEQWRASLAKATNFSQTYLHLATLERAVMWSKSLMNVRCRICRRKTGDEYLLLCDGCDHGYHTYCLRPPLAFIPEGDWFCYNCVPITPVKPK